MNDKTTNPFEIITRSFFLTVYNNRSNETRKMHIPATMCIIHKGFRGFRAVSPASILGGNLIGLKPAIPYDTIHSTLPFIRRKNFAN